MKNAILNRISSVVFIAFLIGFVLALSACKSSSTILEKRDRYSISSGNNSAEADSTIENDHDDQNTNVTYQTIDSGLTYKSIPEIAHKADIIVIGMVTAEKDIINTSRDPRDPSKPSSKIFGIGQVYSVQIERYIKGNGDKTIPLVLGMGSIPTKDNIGTPNPTEIEHTKAANINIAYVPLSINRPYLMFLRVIDKNKYALDGYYSNELYAGVLPSFWRYDITDPACARPESIHSNKYFPPAL